MFQRERVLFSQPSYRLAPRVWMSWLPGLPLCSTPWAHTVTGSGAVSPHLERGWEPGFPSFSSTSSSGSSSSSSIDFVTSTVNHSRVSKKKKEWLSHSRYVHFFLADSVQSLLMKWRLTIALVVPYGQIYGRWLRTSIKVAPSWDVKKKRREHVRSYSQLKYSDNLRNVTNQKH